MADLPAREAADVDRVLEAVRADRRDGVWDGISVDAVA